MARNCHGVPKKQWAKWRGRPQAMFNRLWSELGFELKEAQKAGSISPRLMHVIRWNVCWLAAGVEKELDADAKLGWFNDRKAGR